VNLVGWGLTGATLLAGLSALAVLLAPWRHRPLLAGVGTAGVGAAGLVAGVAAVGGVEFHAHLPELLPMLGIDLLLDPLGGLFTAVAGGVILVAAAYGVGYAARGHGNRSRSVQTVLPLFAFTLLLVPAAASVSTLLVLWELMALTSLVLVLADHRARPQVTSAGLWYAVMTHLGFVAILAGLVVFAATAGGDTFEALRAAQLSPTLASVVFAAALVGFGSKAGLVPLHVWLPRAHPEAPSQVSAMLSAAMVNLGVYGVVRVGFDLLGGGPAGWWLVVLGLGAASALYGILHAAMASDLKRLLAYSTVENMGLVFLAVGVAGLFHSHGEGRLAAVAMAAGLLHVINHSGFKTVLFLAAGSVLRATGSRNLDALGGLSRRMPVTTGLFAFGALGAMALPPSNGFVSEWLLLQSLVHPPAGSGVVTAVVLPLAVAVVALTAGLATATFVKAIGAGFFARARSHAAEQAVEAPSLMLTAVAVAAAACVALAVAPTALGPTLSRVSGSTLGVSPEVVSGTLTVRLTGITSTISPLLILVALVAAVALTVLLVQVVARRPARRRDAPLWDCGAGQPTPRMQYTATSFAEPLQRVFDDVLAPETGVDTVTHHTAPYVLARVRYQRRLPDRIEHWLYRPVLFAVTALGRAARGLANGSVHRYLAYGFFGTVGLLVALVVIP
jgi:hydrogenase-4 component B